MNIAAKKDITWHEGAITRLARERIHGHRGVTIWFTGLSGSGKSTLARRVEQWLLESEVFAYVLDGDNIRHGLNKDLGFSHEDRTENIRRIGEVAKLFTDAGAVTIVAFISPYRNDREQARQLIGADDFVEVFISAPLEVCEERDPKGLYKKARAGQIQEFTGITAPYEAPTDAGLVVDTANQDVDTCATQIMAVLEERGVLASSTWQVRKSQKP